MMLLKRDSPLLQPAVSDLNNWVAELKFID